MEGFSGRQHHQQHDFHQSQSTFKMLRRLHGHNLESQGLNNLSEAFQNFVTRAKFFSLGRLRRTWSHSAVEFMKYRRLLPMIVGDEHDAGSVFDEFLDIGPDGMPRAGQRSQAEQLGFDERRLSVTNVSAKVTKSQLQAFFNKFGKVQSCHVPADRSRHQSHQTAVGLYATMPKRKWHGSCVITFKSAQSALRARTAPADELLFYGQQMAVGPYITSVGSSRRRTTSNQSQQNFPTKELDAISAGKLQPETATSPEFSIGGGGLILSRTSSASSLASTGTGCSCSSVATVAGPFSASSFPLDELPDRVLALVLLHASPLDRIRLERVNKRWLEAAAKAWTECRRLRLADEPALARHFSAGQPLRQHQLRAILRRCGPHLRALSLADVNQLLEEKAIAEIGQLCPKLEELDLSGLSAQPETLRALTEQLPGLRRLAYRQMGQNSERHFWFLFKAVAGQLRALDLRGCARLRGTFFRLFGTELEELLLDGCSRLEDRVLEDIVNRCCCVRRLKLDACRRLTDEGLSLISRHLSELDTLTLCGQFPNFTASGLAQITRIGSLQCLSLDYNPLVDDQLLGSIASGLPQLRQLSLAFAGSDRSISASGLAQLASLAQLQRLDVSGLAALNGQAFGLISAGCPQLRRLTMRSCSYLGDDGLLSGVAKLVLLEEADLSGCILISNDSVQKLCNMLKEEEEPIAQPKSLAIRRPVCLIIGGTICEPHKIRRPRGCRVVLDPADNSSLGLLGGGGGENNNTDQLDDDDEEDDEFRILTAHRNFVTDVLQAEEEDNFPSDEDPKSIMEWAQREAAHLGLLEPTK